MILEQQNYDIFKRSSVLVATELMLKIKHKT